MQTSQKLSNVALVVVVFALFKNLSLFKMVQSASVDHCYSDIGCFPLSAEFYHPKHRPFNVRPWHRQHIRTQFELFNRHHPEGFIMEPWDRANLLESKFNPKLETKIILPGWLDNINRALWVRKMKDALLWLWVPVNVVVVRWTNFTPYTIATANTRVVGAEMANWMKFIDQELHYDPAYYHIIGHSLGAHIAGYCGDRVHGLGRITALDPARPFFQHMPKSVRLDRSDAKFVDAIHSDFTPENAIFLLMSYGMTTPVGHVDFYPNGPPLFQPGCLRDTLLSVQTGIAKGLEHNSLSVAFLESVRYLTACDHQRSHEWFLESITNRECVFVGVRCNEFEGMINGRCTCDDSPSACAIMGIHADQMYLHQVHEELWPVRVGSIDYKYNKRPLKQPKLPFAQPPPLPQQQQPDLGYMTQGALGLNLEQFDQSLGDNYNLLQQTAVLSMMQQQQQQQQNGPPASMLANKDEIYARLKHQAMQMHKQGEPSIGSLFDYNHDREDQMQSASTERTSTVEEQDEIQSHDDNSNRLEETLDQIPEASSANGAYDFDQHLSALDDLAFAGYLRSQLILGELATITNSTASQTARPMADDAADDDQESDGENDENSARRRSGGKLENNHETDGYPAQFEGHPKLISSVNRDIEYWYEDNARWHLKTNSQPKYCSNQYQLLIFLGPLKSSRHNRGDRLRADLLVSIVGSRGQLMNQRFVPRGSSLTPFTMQPFFILLEGSYSLGQIKSVALSWEARNDPDPVQATVTFQSSLVEELGKNVVAYKAKQFPWMPEETKYDKTAGFSASGVKIDHQPMAPKPPIAPSLQMATSSLSHGTHQRLYRRPSEALKSGIKGHYSNKYQILSKRDRRQDSGLKEYSSASNEGECSMHESSSSNCRLESNSLKRRSDSIDEMPNSIVESNSTTNSQADQEDSLAEQNEAEQQLLQLQQVNNQQRQDLLVEQLMLLEGQHQSNLANSQMPNQTYLVDSEDQLASAAEALADYNRQEDALALTASDSYFVPLIDPLDETASYTPRPGSNIPAEDLVSHEGEVKINFHNLPHHSDNSDDDSIVVNQVVVSPLQASYGRHRRTAKTFCPPVTKQRLTRDKTLHLTLSMMSKCSEHHLYEQHLRQRQKLFSYV